MPQRYEQVEEGKWYDWDRRNNRDGCCDCCLVHIVDYRIAKRGKRLVIQSRCWRDNKATYAARRRAGISLLEKTSRAAKRRTKKRR